MTQVLKSPDNGLVRIELDAFCHDCRHRHRVSVDPHSFSNQVFDWERKHRGHRFEFLLPERTIPRGFDDRVFEREGQAPWWLTYKHNADVKIEYAADAAFSITLASLASSSTWLAGQESASVSNGTLKYLDYEITGKITTGSVAPTVDTVIQMRGIKPINDTPTWPANFDGTNSAATITSTYIRDKFPILWQTQVSTATATPYPIGAAQTLAQAWGLVPSTFSVFVAHNLGQALSATGGDHEINYTGVFATVI